MLVQRADGSALWESGSYFYLVLTDGTPCTNAVFGDPTVGVATLYYRPTTLVPTLVPSTTVATAILTAVSEWTFCADANGTCSFSGMKEVRYRESGYYKYLIFTGSTPYTNTVFGDPIPGVYKHCYYRDTTLVPTATPDLNATALAFANATATVFAANTTATAVAANATATVVAAANQTATAYAAANPMVSVNAVRDFHSKTVKVDIVLKTALMVTIYDSQSNTNVVINRHCAFACSFNFDLSGGEKAAGTVTVTVIWNGGPTPSRMATVAGIN